METAMKMRIKFKDFTSEDDGAVTVDWVVLTASVCGLVVLAIAGLQGNMTSIGENAGNILSNLTINTN
jgi:Flp pilus assembly pilin Flp